MKLRTVPSSWFEKEGRRLDCGPYLSGAIEAKVLLEKLPVKKALLCEVTKEGSGGIFHAGREGRTYLNDPAYGVSFLGSTDILAADLSWLPFISKKQVERNPLFTIQEGWTLITRSGTIGRMAYARPEMAGMACSEHVMRVVPDPDKVLPGYLFAYLSSRFGVPIIMSGTYGAIIQHIEPSHIADLPVPLPHNSFQEAIHNLINKSAQLRTDANNEISAVGDRLLERTSIKPMKGREVSSTGVSVLSSVKMGLRFDATYHSEVALEAESLVSAASVKVKTLLEVCERMFKPSMFKRLWVDDSQYGRQFISGQDAYKWASSDCRFVSLRTPNFDDYLLKRGWLVFQAAGQTYGLFGRPLFVYGWLENLFCADDIYRVIPRNEVDGAYMYAWLRTPHGRALLVRQACGYSIPRVWDPHVSKVLIPWPDELVREEIAQIVIQAHEALEKARLLERKAVAQVEDWILSETKDKVS